MVQEVIMGVLFFGTVRCLNNKKEYDVLEVPLSPLCVEK
jgi:hypothetical protein